PDRRNWPQLVPTVLRTAFGLEIPDDGRPTLTSAPFAGLKPAELRGDAAVLLDQPTRLGHGGIADRPARPLGQACRRDRKGRRPFRLPHCDPRFINRP